MKTKRDKIFKKGLKAKFSFNKEVASVFDDMLSRSVPYYNDNIALIANLLENSNKICDIGCSTGNALLVLAQKFPNKFLFGIDNSNAMLEIARTKASAYGLNIYFQNEDILDFSFKIPRDFIKIAGADSKKDSKKNSTKDSKKDSAKNNQFNAIIANYTMQFIRPQKRESLCKKIYENLQKNGIFIMSEKLICEDKWLDKKLIDIYHHFKAENGYSKTEISKKREALENILIPFSQDENVTMLKNAGFKSVEVVFRFGNFATFIARKQEK